MPSSPRRVISVAVVLALATLIGLGAAAGASAALAHRTDARHHGHQTHRRHHRRRRARHHARHTHARVHVKTTRAKSPTSSARSATPKAGSATTSTSAPAVSTGPVSSIQSTSTATPASSGSSTPSSSSSTATTPTAGAGASPVATPDYSTDSSGADCGGESLTPKPGGGTWQCTFDDEFDSATGDADSLNSEWVPQQTADSGFYDGPSDAQECFVDNPDTISVSGGALHLTVLKTAAPFDCGGMFTTSYEGGEVMTDNTFDQTYGRYEVRALLPQTEVQGLQETFWLWPQNYQPGTWPGSGEIDLAEFYSDYENLDVPFLHYDFNSSTTDAQTSTNIDTQYCQIDPTQYNDYAVVWAPGQISISINGQTCLTDNYIASGGSPDAPFNSPFFITLTQALGIGNNAFIPGQTPLPATTSIQYVRVWD